jgi:small GTP-binding protein
MEIVAGEKELFRSDGVIDVAQNVRGRIMITNRKVLFCPLELLNSFLEETGRSTLSRPKQSRPSLPADMRQGNNSNNNNHKHNNNEKEQKNGKEKDREEDVAKSASLHHWSHAVHVSLARVAAVHKSKSNKMECVRIHCRGMRTLVFGFDASDSAKLCYKAIASRLVPAFHKSKAYQLSNWFAFHHDLDSDLAARFGFDAAENDDDGDGDDVDYDDGDAVDDGERKKQTKKRKKKKKGRSSGGGKRSSKRGANNNSAAASSSSPALASAVGPTSRSASTPSMAVGHAPLANWEGTLAAASTANVRRASSSRHEHSDAKLVDGWHMFDVRREFVRQCADMKRRFRVTSINKAFKLCESYPMVWMVPSVLDDADLLDAASHYAGGRLPLISWYDSSSGALVATCRTRLNDVAPPLASDRIVDVLKNESQGHTLHIFSAETKEQAIGHRERAASSSAGAGHGGAASSASAAASTSARGPSTDASCRRLPLIVDSNESALLARNALVELCCSSFSPSAKAVQEWGAMVTRSISAAVQVVSSLATGNSVLIEGSDAIDVEHIVSTVLLLVDPYYRTVEGFQVLVEKEWLRVGHEFLRFAAKPSSKSTYTNDEISPLFLMFVDGVWQLLYNYPRHFEFSESLLLFLLDSIYSGEYGTWLCSSDKQRADSRIALSTPSVWTKISAMPRATFDNSYASGGGASTTAAANGDETARHRRRRRRRHGASQPSGDGSAGDSLDSLASALTLDVAIRLPYVLWTSYFVLSNPRQQASLGGARHLIASAYARGATKLELTKAQLCLVPLDCGPLVSWRRWTQLLEVDLSGNLLTRLPECLAMLPALEHLSLARNELPVVPSEHLRLLGAQCTRIKSLDLSHNSVKALPEGLGALRELRELNVAHNALRSVHSALGGRLRRLRVLDLSSNRLEDLPSEFEALQRLEVLDLSHNRRLGGELPLCVLRMRALADLRLAGLGLTSLPAELAVLESLRSLDLSQNCFETLPLHVCRLYALRRLVMAENALRSLPLEVANLTQLEHFDLRDNVNLDSLSSGVGNLASLRVLSLTNCRALTQLPSNFGLLVGLRQLNLVGCTSLKTPPREIVSQGIDATLQFMKDLLGGAAPCYRMKLMIVGQENVGKTSLLRSLMRKKSSSGASKGKVDINTISTDGIDIEPWSFVAESVSQRKPGGGAASSSGGGDKQVITLSAWDFAGQELYYTTHQFFLSARSVYIAVFNLVQGVETSKLDFWLQSIRSRAGADVPIVLVGTHLDHYTSLHKNWSREALVDKLDRRYRRRFPNIVAMHLVSCVTQKGVDQLRVEIERLVARQPHMGEELPTSYLELEKMVLHEKSRVPPIVSWRDFSGMAQICNIRDEKELVSATRLLHNLGSLSHFDDDGLRDIIILDPQWLCDVMSTIITTKHSYIKNGILEHRDLPQIWRPPQFPERLHPTLLKLLQKFSIILCLPKQRMDDNDGDGDNGKRPDEKQAAVKGKSGSPSLSSMDSSNDDDDDDSSIHLDEDSALMAGKSLVPSLLPLRRPGAAIEELFPSRSDEAMLGRKYRFDFIPTGLFSRLMVRLLHITEPKVFWRNGFVFYRGKEKLFIEQLPTKRTIFVTARGSDTSNFRLVLDALDSLTTDFFHLSPSVSIPCCHCLEQRTSTPFMFPLEVCEMAAMRGRPFVLCSGVRPIRIDQLVPDITLTEVATPIIDFRDVRREHKIGRGGYSVVYKGRYNDEPVAIKRIKVAPGQDAGSDDAQLEAFRQFRREVWIMSCLEHANIVRLIGFCLDPCCIITEFVAHGNLFDYAHDAANELLWPLRLRIAMDVAKGMAFLHNSRPPIIHRDLKSPNVLLAGTDAQSRRPVAKVTDFGVSHVLAPTAAGRVVACPVWLAPEVIRDELYTQKADIYSFGVILFEILERREFFGEVEFLSEVQEHILAGERPSFSDDCIPSYANLMQACWDQSPENRPSFADVIDVLALIMQKYNMSVSCDIYEQDDDMPSGMDDIEIDMIEPSSPIAGNKVASIGSLSLSSSETDESDDDDDGPLPPPVISSQGALAAAKAAAEAKKLAAETKTLEPIDIAPPKSIDAMLDDIDLNIQLLDSQVVPLDARGNGANGSSSSSDSGDDDENEALCVSPGGTRLRTTHSPVARERRRGSWQIDSDDEARIGHLVRGVGSGSSLKISYSSSGTNLNVPSLSDLEQQQQAEERSNNDDDDDDDELAALEAQLSPRSRVASKRRRKKRTPRKKRTKKSGGAGKGKRKRRPKRRAVGQRKDDGGRKQVDVPVRLDSLASSSSAAAAATNSNVVHVGSQFHATLASLDRSILQLCRVSDNFVWAGCSDGSVAVFDIEAERLSALHDAHSARIYGITRVGEFVWTCGRDEVLRVWRPESNGAISLFKELPNQKTFCLLPIGLSVVWGGATNGRIYVYDASSLKVKRQLKPDVNCVTALLLFNGMVWVGGDRVILRLRPTNGKVIDFLQGHQKTVHALEGIRDQVWSASSDKTIRAWSASSGECLRVLEGHTGRVFALLAEGNRFMWSAGWDTTLVVWNAETFEFAQEHIERHTDAVGSLLLVDHSAKQPQIWSGSWDRTICLWSPRVPIDVFVADKKAAADNTSGGTSSSHEPTSPSRKKSFARFKKKKKKKKT